MNRLELLPNAGKHLWVAVIFIVTGRAHLANATIIFRYTYIPAYQLMGLDNLVSVQLWKGGGVASMYVSGRDEKKNGTLECWAQNGPIDSGYRTFR